MIYVPKFFMIRRGLQLRASETPSSAQREQVLLAVLLRGHAVQIPINAHIVELETLFEQARSESARLRVELQQSD
jgi:hypothetical protein